MDNQKELSVVKTQAQKALVAVTDLVIKTPEDYAKADEVRNRIKLLGKAIKEKKESITKPLNEGLKNIRELFKPIETTHEHALEIIDSKMIYFRKLDSERIEKEKEKLASKLESGYIKQETAIAKAETLGDTKTNLKVAGVKTSIRKLARVKILNESLVPREYLSVNERLVLEALKAGKQVAGAELYYEEIIA